MMKQLCTTFAMAAMLGTFLTGCPTQPRLSVSGNSHHFGIIQNTDSYETEWSFQIWNSGKQGTELVVTVTADQPWIDIAASANTSTGEDDPIDVTVTIDRDYSDLKAAAFSSGEIEVSASVGTEVIAITTAPDFFTESFNASSDLDGLALTFVPNGGPSFYGATRDEISEFPTDPSEAANFPLSFEDFGDPIQAGLFGDATATFYGVEYDTLYISSEGWISFGEEGNDPVTAGAHFAVPQISGPPMDATAEGSVVSYQQDADKLVITYDNAATKGVDGGSNDFQVELFFDGTLRVSFLEIDPAGSGIFGLSNGSGQSGLPPADFLESDLSGYNTAPLK